MKATEKFLDGAIGWKRMETGTQAAESTIEQVSLDEREDLRA